MKTREIILLGGAGDVGMRLSRLLLANTSATITTVSRRAKTATGQAGDRLRHVSVDLAQGEKFDLSANSLVVNLTEATQPDLARQVISSGGCFLETSALPAYLNAITQAAEATKGPGTAILCVGAAPGLTNLLAAEITAKAPDTARIDIGFEMGMGRHYGVAGTEWFLQTAGRPYPVVIDHALKQMAPGQLTRKFAFDQGGPLLSAIGYGFADQTIIAARSDRTLGTVRSFVALDPSWMTRGFLVALRLGLGPAIGRNARRLTRWLRKTPALGHTRTRVVVEGFDGTGQLTGHIRLETGDQADATAAMIFATLVPLLEIDAPGGPPVTTITDHLSFDAALTALRQVLPDTNVSASFARPVQDRIGAGN